MGWLIWEFTPDSWQTTPIMSNKRFYGLVFIVFFLKQLFFYPIFYNSSKPLPRIGGGWLYICSQRVKVVQNMAIGLLFHVKDVYLHIR